MALQPMYPAASGAAPTQLSQLASATVTTIAVQDAGRLPEGPNLATIGRDEDAEVIRYAAIQGGALTGCQRGFGGTTARIWPAGTDVYRAYTAHEHNTFCENLTALEAGKLSAQGGDASGATVAFTAAQAVLNIFSGESLAAIAGKLARWYSAFGQAAWASFGTGYAAVARGDHTHSQYAPLDAEGKLAAQAASAKSVAVSATRALTVADAGRCLDATSATGITITIPTDAQANLPVDTEIELSQEGEGGLTIQASGGVTLCGMKGSKSSFEVAGRYGVAVLKKKGANDWRIAGDVL